MFYRWKRKPAQLVPPKSVLLLAQRFDQFVLVHVRTAFDVEFPHPLVEIVLAPFFVGIGLATLLRRLLRRVGLGVGDACCLFLRRAILAQRFIDFVVFDAGAVVLGDGSILLLRR